MSISFDPVGGNWWTPVTIGVLGAVLILLLGPRGQFSSRQQIILLALRLCLTVVLVGLLLRPSVLALKRERLSGTVVFLVDQSRSMLVADGPQGQTRDTVLRNLLEAFQPRIESLAQQVQLQAFCFGDELNPVPVERGKLQLPVAPTGNQSPVGWALEEVLRQQVGQRVVAVILFSDGAQKAEGPQAVSPYAAATALARSGIAVHTVALGEPRGAGRFLDVAIERLAAPETSLVDNEVLLTVDVHAEGYPGTKLPLEVLLSFPGASDQSQVVASAELSVPTVSHYQQVSVTFTPQSPGEFKLLVRIPPQAGEAISENNQRATILRVSKGGIRVLVIEGFPPRPELAFVRRALSQGPELQLQVLMIDPTRPEAYARELEAAIQEREFQVYLLGNVPAAVFPSELLSALVAKVGEGSGLIMLGGKWSFGPGGYADGPIADILPVRMSHLEVQGPNEPPRSDVHIEGPIHLRPTADGSRHPLLKAWAENATSEAIWAKLPPLEGINRFAGLKPAAQVLLESTKGHPVLVYQPVGAGRVVAFAGDSTWRWAMGGFRPFFERFWRQLVLFVAKREALPEGQLWIQLAQRVWEARKPITFEVHHGFSGHKEPISVSGQIRNAQGSEGGKLPLVNLDLHPSGKHWEGRFVTPDNPGDYFLEVVAKNDQGVVETATARFLVVGRDREMEQPAADIALLQRIAALTGGVFVRPEEFDRILDRLGEQANELEMTLQVARSLWDRWPWLALVLSLASTEWFLRRRWGMV